MRRLGLFKTVLRRALAGLAAGWRAWRDLKRSDRCQRLEREIFDRHFGQL